MNARALRFCSYCLGIIFDYHKIVALGELLNSFVPTWSAVEVNRHYATSASIDYLFDFRSIEVERSSIGIYKSRYKRIACYGEHRSDISVGRHDDLVAIGKDSFLFVCSDD